MKEPIEVGDRNKTLTLTAALVLMLSAWTAPPAARAGYFDCSVVYDEFESLMNKRFLVEPSNYVVTIKDRMSREEYIGLQQGKLLLTGPRAGKGVGVIRTNRNSYARFVFSWGESLHERAPPLVVHETVIYGRVEDGYAPQRLRPLTVNPGFGIDFDEARVLELPRDDQSGEATPERETTADLAHIDSGEQLYIEAVNGATVEFPVESMCHSPGEGEDGGSG